MFRYFEIYCNSPDSHPGREIPVARLMFVPREDGSLDWSGTPIDALRVDDAPVRHDSDWLETATGEGARWRRTFTCDLCGDSVLPVKRNYGVLSTC